MTSNSELPSGHPVELSCEEISRYHRDGQIEPAWRLLDDILQRMRTSLEHLVSARRDIRPDLIALPHVPWHDRELKMSGGSATAPVEFKERPIWLIRGVDRCGLNDFETGHTH
jgi:hypothetical protein